MAQYAGAAVIPIDLICRDYFSHLTTAKFTRKANAGELGFPVVRMEASQKSARGVHITDFAAYLDERRAVGRAEFEKMAA